MKSFVRCWLITVFVLGPGVVYATGCKVAVRRQQVVQQVVVQKNVAVVAAVAAVAVPVVATYIPVAVPTYNAVYAPGAGYGMGRGYSRDYDGGSEQDSSETMKQLANVLRAIDGRLQRLEGGVGRASGGPGVPVPMPPADPVPPVPPPQGGGGLAELTPDQNAAVISMVAKGIMPHKAPLGLEARLKFIDTLTSGTDAEILSVVRANCSSCHDQKTAAAKGKGFVLTK